MFENAKWTHAPLSLIWLSIIVKCESFRKTLEYRIDGYHKCSHDQTTKYSGAYSENDISTNSCKCLDITSNLCMLHFHIITSHRNFQERFRCLTIVRYHLNIRKIFTSWVAVNHVKTPYRDITGTASILCFHGETDWFGKRNPISFHNSWKQVSFFRWATICFP